MAARVERDDLQAYVGPPGRLDERFELGAHHLEPTDEPAQGRFVDDRPQLRRVGAVELVLARHAQRDPAVDLGLGCTRVPEQDDGAGVLGCL